MLWISAAVIPGDLTLSGTLRRHTGVFGLQGGLLLPALPLTSLEKGVSPSLWFNHHCKGNISLCLISVLLVGVLILCLPKGTGIGPCVTAPLLANLNSVPSVLGVLELREGSVTDVRK